ncbi:MAG: TrkH family potassium uptake protein [Bacteroidales bacterium]|nr:TrkH family potassium uptake protein [Bacteroidales bacterium]
MKSKLFGVLLLIETAALLLTALVAWYYNIHYDENDLNAFLITAGITGVVGLALFLIGAIRKTGIDSDDTFVIVALSWILFSIFGMLPFLLSGAIDNVTDAFFETISGFTTTGSTILKNVDDQPHGILFWRSIMQWLGGLGIVVFTLAFLPSVAKGSRKSALFAAEAPGVSVEKLSPTMHGTSRILWFIYIFLTLLCTAFYAFGPMSFFDAVCHAMTTISTGGFSNYQDSIGYFHSTYIEYVSIVFMIFSSINFAMFYFLVVGRFDLLRKNEEVKVYLVSLAVMTLLFIGLFYIAPSIKGVTAAQLESYPQGGKDIFRVSFFHVVSMLSNTGFAGVNNNYDLWGLLFVIPTLLMQIVGGCAGSASGGIKMVRVIVIFKFIKNALKELLHPTGMYSLKVSGQMVDELTIRRVCNFLSLFMILFIVNVLALTFLGMSLEDAAIAFLTCFSNLGMGSGATGPGASLADLPTAAKWIVSFDMLVGRLEIITVLLIFFRSTWVTTKGIKN